jgi:MOSC domain-containing protein YiiM
MPYGSLGENILVNFNPYDLPTGKRFQIADTILEISQNCTMCDHLSDIDTRLPDLLKNDRGIFAKVIQGGVIKVGDTITLL